jgi:hypothetical protein
MQTNRIVELTHGNADYCTRESRGRCSERLRAGLKRG